jgi:hypothetical protein
VWAKLLSEFEKQLPLLNGQSGDLEALADYIHHRTKGFFEPLNALLTKGVQRAIDADKERFTRALLTEIDLDYLSEVSNGHVVGETRARAPQRRRGGQRRTNLVNRPTSENPDVPGRRSSKTHRPRQRPDTVSGY